MQPKSIDDLREQVDTFNARYRVGQAVILRKDDGTGFHTVTRSRAQLLSGHSAVVWVEGLAGCYLLDRITPLVGEAA